LGYEYAGAQAVPGLDGGPLEAIVADVLRIAEGAGDKRHPYCHQFLREIQCKFRAVTNSC